MNIAKISGILVYYNNSNLTLINDFITSGSHGVLMVAGKLFRSLSSALVLIASSCAYLEVGTVCALLLLQESSEHQAGLAGSGRECFERTPDHLARRLSKRSLVVQYAALVAPATHPRRPSCHL